MRDSDGLLWVVAGAAAASVVFWKRDAIASALRTSPPPPPRLALPAPPNRITPRPVPAPSAPPPAPAQPQILDDAVALGRVITSEIGSGTPAERDAVAWIARNRARARKVSIAKLVCTPDCGPCCKGRPFSSRREAAARDLGLAIRVLAAPQSADPTGGATSFFEPVLQDRWVAEGRPGYNFSAAQVRERWRADGLVPVAIIGRLETWRRGG